MGSYQKHASDSAVTLAFLVFVPYYLLESVCFNFFCVNFTHQLLRPCRFRHTGGPAKYGFELTRQLEGGFVTSLDVAI